MEYKPSPIQTDDVLLTKDIKNLTELLAGHIHDIWAMKRMGEGWRYGPNRNDVKKTHPGLVPYDKLTDSEKDYDRKTALESLKAIIALGYTIEKRDE